MDFWDDYQHRDPKLTYIYENIKTKEVEDEEKELPGCECVEKCEAPFCACLQRSGGLYKFSTIYDLNDYVLSITDNKPIYECNVNCRCENKKCGNKLVQFGPRKNLEIVNFSESKGAAIITKSLIQKGNFICEYIGEMITSIEAQKRFEKYKELEMNHNYIFCINENFGGRNVKTFIDPTFYGNIGRYINHSCEPNSFLLPVRINSESPKLCIFAGENIPEKTEITFDYGSSRNNNLKGKKCLCLSSKCKNFLPYDSTIF